LPEAAIVARLARHERKMRDKRLSGVACISEKTERTLFSSENKK